MLCWHWFYLFLLEINKILCDENETFWDVFTISIRHCIWKKGFDILQNIQDKYNLSKIRKPKDRLQQETIYMGDECQCDKDMKVKYQMIMC